MRNPHILSDTSPPALVMTGARPVVGTSAFPSPQPAPPGRVGNLGYVLANPTRPDQPDRATDSSLSSGERAGVRGKGATFALTPEPAVRIVNMDDPPGGARWVRARKALMLAMAVALVNGCETGTRSGSAMGPLYHPTNVYRQPGKFPAHIRRVAVLPVSIEERDGQAEAGREQLQAVLLGELGKTKIFEAVFVSPEQLLRWTGAETWKAESKLPPSLFEHLQDELGCNGVLFSHLRPYHAYRPLVVGWNFKLVDMKAQAILWSADEVFDANEKDVARSAQQYYSTHAGGGQFLDDPASILASPRGFTQYTLSALLATLPER